VRRGIEAGRRAARDLRAQLRGAGSRRGRSHALTLLTPIKPRAAAELARVLRALPTGEDSPLALLPDVHFARWVVIDRLNTDWPRTPRRPSRLRSDYLMFTADVTVPRYEGYTLPDSFLRQLIARIPEAADRVWGFCLEYPGARNANACIRYLADSQVDASLYYVGFPDVTVNEIRRALAARDGLVRFVREHQGRPDPGALQQAYLAEARQWFH
jgi:hypothetical protein